LFTEKFPFPVDGKAKFHPISKAVFTVAEEHKAEKEPPSLVVVVQAHSYARSAARCR
jgi:hypothetical protein